MKKNDYYWSESSSPFSEEELKTASKEVQLAVMKEWFFHFFENPAENTPYETKEGGYIYLWGGPYDAKEELQAEFSEIVSKDVVEELIEELESESPDWAAKPKEELYDDYYYGVISSNTEFHDTLSDSLTYIKKLLNSGISEELVNPLNMMLYVNIVTSIETFLSDAFISTVIGNNQLMRKFVESNTDFSDRKFPLNEIYNRMDNIEKKIRNYLLDLIWHNLAKIEKIYKHTLDVDFPDNVDILYKVIAKRHDIVHRGGKTKDGVSIIVTKDELILLIEEVKSFADNIDSAEVFKKTSSVGENII